MTKTKRDLKSRIAAAAEAGSPPVDRFEHAAAVLAARPTGYSHVIEAAAARPSAPAYDAVGGPEHRVIPVELIDENPFNARRIYREERIKELALSLATPQGQIVPGIATVRDGRYVLAAGHYRLRALRHAGIPAMHLMVHYNLTDRQLYEISLRENDERDDQSALDNALAWRDLIDKGVYPNEVTLAEAIGKSLPLVNKTIAILKLSPGVLDVVKQNPAVFPFSGLYELTLLERAAGTPVAEQTAQRLLAQEIGRKEIQELRERYETPRTRKKKEMSRHYRIISEGQPVGVIKDFDDGRVLFEIKVSSPDERQDLVAFLKGRFGMT